MEEADEILLLTLRQAGCDIPAGVERVGQMEPGTLYSAIAQALDIITGGGTRLPKKLSPSVAVRHRVCTALNEQMKALGCRDEVGYQQIVYPSVKETRRILMWLSEKLPKAEEAGPTEVHTRAGILRSRIRQSLEKWTKPLRTPAQLRQLGGDPGYSRPWIPRSFRPRPSTSAAMPAPILARPVPSDSPSAAERDYFQKFAPLLHPQAPTASLRARALLLRLDAATERTARLERRFGAGPSADRERRAQRAQRLAETKARARHALSSALHQAPALPGSCPPPAFGTGLDTAAQLSLEDLQERLRQAYGGAGRGARTAFQREELFGQEAPTVVAELAGGGVEGGGAGEGGAAPPTPAKAGEEPKDEETLAREREEEVGVLERALQEAEGAVRRARKEAELAVAAKRATEASLDEARTRQKELEREFKLQRHALELLPEAERHIRELGQECDDADRRLTELAAEWETHRRPLIEAIRQYKQAEAERLGRADELLAGAGRMRAEMQTLAEQIREREQQAHALAAEYERSPKEGTSRSVYTRRILDIVRQVRKQKEEIDQIIGDVREVQQEIAVVADKLERTAQEANEGIYAAVTENRDKPAYVEAYRTFTELRQIFSSLVQAVQRTGQADAEQRDLELQTEALHARVTNRNRDRVMQDLEEIRRENRALRRQLRAARGGSGGGGGGGGEE